MKRKQRMRAIWIAAGAALAMAAIVVPLLVFAGSEKPAFTATLYSDAIRFEADGVASLRVTIYDLSENELWSSGQVMGGFVDWDRTNARGERLANGYYMYLAQGWDAGDALILNKTGKVVLLPGDHVQLQSAPGAVGSSTDPGLDQELTYRPMAGYDAVDFAISGSMGIGTDTPVGRLHVADGALTVSHSAAYLRFQNTNSNDGVSGGALLSFIAADGTQYGWIGDGSHANNHIQLYSILGNVAVRSFSAGKKVILGDSTGDVLSVVSGKVGVGTSSTTAKLTVEATSGDLIACYPSGSRTVGAAVFRVESDGDVYADGTVYSDKWEVGAADVAERINVSEWVEAGDVVEIDPDHTGFFRKARGLYSRRVAGIISTSPGVVLGNDVDEATDEWDDGRPVLAVAGRVPVKVSAENGPIAVGDLLVTSSVSGVAMRGDPRDSIGSVVGKAMQPFAKGVGEIMAQVMLR